MKKHEMKTKQKTKNKKRKKKTKGGNGTRQKTNYLVNRVEIIHIVVLMSQPQQRGEIGHTQTHTKCPDRLG